jgi:site-specific DNA-methyltransferase (cytosine-N4-specific)
VTLAYRTASGIALAATVEDSLNSDIIEPIKGKVNLIFTSPPFPLTYKKDYGNKIGEEYKSWLSDLAPRLTELLAPDGSIVLEIGNAWAPGKPIMSTLPLEALLAFRESAALNLCQQFICQNPTRLPGPAQWVNVERIRVKDSYTHVWWMAKTQRPKADNRRVLLEYGNDMKRLLITKKYNSGLRPSGHRIGETSFFKDNGGAIPSSVLTFSNTSWNADYINYCRNNNLPPHPARMQPGLAEFFIKFLTDEKDLVLDPFAGSNTTGAIAEQQRRLWLSIEPNKAYVEGSKARFKGLLDLTQADL